MIFWGAVLIVGGVIFVAFHYLTFRVPSDRIALPHRLDKRQFLSSGINFGLRPQNLININPTSVEVKDVELPTPDNGLIKVSVDVLCSPDTSSRLSLELFCYASNEMDCKKAIESRVRSALHSWIQQKKEPGTSRRAMTMKHEAEQYLMKKLGEPAQKEALYRWQQQDHIKRSRIHELGISIHQIEFTDMQEIKPGTGKANWGDGDEAIFNAKNIFKEFQAHAHNLSSLRKLKEALIERYRDEVDDIEDIYDQVRISMKETRD